MIKIGSIIKHEEFKDVAIIVTQTQHNNARAATIVRGTWLNQGVNKSFLLPAKCEVEIEHSELFRWFVCESPDVECVRDSNWSRIGSIKNRYADDYLPDDGGMG